MDSENKKKILLIDDDKDLHFIQSYILKKHDFAFLSAYSGAEGLQVAMQEKPDLILLDYMMPGMNGKQVLAQIASNPEYESIQAIPIVMLTAAMIETRGKRELLDSGLSAFLEKPFGDKELINVLESVLITQKQQQVREDVVRNLRQNSDFFSGIIENYPGLIFTTDAGGTITFLNDGALGKFFTDEIPQKKILDFCNIAGISFEDILDEINENDKFVSREATIFLGNGDEMPVDLYLTHFKDIRQNNSGILGIARDLTVQKQLEEERLERARTTTIVQTMATLNHEINNPLVPILGNIDLLVADGDELPGSIRGKLAIIQENAKRIATSVEKLRTISRPFLTQYFDDELIIDIEKSQ